MQDVECNYCGFKCSSVDTLKKWCISDHNILELLMVCPVCENGFCHQDKSKYEEKNNDPPDKT